MKKTAMYLFCLLAVGCTTDKHPAIALYEDCEPGSTMSLRVYDGEWDKGVEATCTWVVTEEMKLRKAK